MPITPSTLAETRKAMKNIDLKNAMKGTARLQGLSMTKLSRKLGAKRNYLTQILKSPDIRISLLLALTAHTGMNLLESYLLVLPEPLRETERERTLKAQLAALQQQLDALTKERDLLKEIVMK